jgi:hypothetical protein
VYLKIIHKAPNYLHDHKIICTYNKNFSPDHGEPPDQNSKSWQSINNIAIKLSQNCASIFPIKNIPMTTIIDDDIVYNPIFNSPSITQNPYLCRDTLVDWILSILHLDQFLCIMIES